MTRTREIDPIQRLYGVTENQSGLFNEWMERWRALKLIILLLSFPFAILLLVILHGEALIEAIQGEYLEKRCSEREK